MSNEVAVTPYRKKVLIEVHDSEKSEFGATTLEIPDSALERGANALRHGTVIAVGSDCDEAIQPGVTAYWARGHQNVATGLPGRVFLNSDDIAMVDDGD